MNVTKLINIIHKFEGVAVNDLKTAMEWMSSKTPVAVNAFITAHNITQAFVDEAKSPTGKAIEAIIESVIPQSAPFYPAAIAVVQKMANMCTKVAGEIPAVEGIVNRYAGDIILAIDPTAGTIDDILLEYQKLFTKTSA